MEKDLVDLSVTTGGRQPDSGSTNVIPIAALRPADSPRTDGEDLRHIRMLAEIDCDLPPIVVQRGTMRVIDGMHRLRAAELRNQDKIEVQFYDGDQDAFVMAVKLNVAHGLPLSLADRTAAATRIIAAHPAWSDRLIASVAGLSAKTVGAIRRRETETTAQDGQRIGRDGRARPLNSAAGRMLASRLLSENLDATVRQVAKATGLAPSTVQDVRERLRSGKDPVPPKQRGVADELGKTRKPRAGGASRKVPGPDRAEMLEMLKRDPALRFSEAGRELLRSLGSHITGMREWERFIDQLPPHCTGIVAELAHQNSQDWRAIADEIEHRARTFDWGKHSVEQG